MKKKMIRIVFFRKVVTSHGIELGPTKSRRKTLPTDPNHVTLVIKSPNKFSWQSAYVGSSSDSTSIPMSGRI